MSSSPPGARSPRTRARGRVGSRAPVASGLHVVERGDASAPTVVLVHGYPDDHTVWDPVAERLAGQLPRPSPTTCAGAGSVRRAAPRARLPRRPPRGRHGRGHRRRQPRSARAPRRPRLGLDPVVAHRHRARAGRALPQLHVDCRGPSLDHVGQWFRAQPAAGGRRGLAALARQAVHSTYIYWFPDPPCSRPPLWAARPRPALARDPRAHRGRARATRGGRARRSLAMPRAAFGSTEPTCCGASGGPCRATPTCRCSSSSRRATTSRRRRCSTAIEALAPQPGAPRRRRRALDRAIRAGPCRPLDQRARRRGRARRPTRHRRAGHQWSSSRAPARGIGRATALAFRRSGCHGHRGRHQRRRGRPHRRAVPSRGQPGGRPRRRCRGPRCDDRVRQVGGGTTTVRPRRPW